MSVRIGCSGWTYKDWTGPFYPAGTKDRLRLEYYASRFDTAEINASFYRLPSEKTVLGWAERAPSGFVFAWKVSRFITHNKKLKDCADSVDLVFGRMAGLGDREGPALVQLPPQLRRDDTRLADFLALLPKGKRCTVEFRHPSWYADQVFQLLADHDAALCVSDHHHAPSPWETTASFVYVRGHGPSGRYFGSYDDAALDGWADSIRGWRERGRDVYAYFDNESRAQRPPTPSGCSLGCPPDCHDDDANLREAGSQSPVVLPETLAMKTPKDTNFNDRLANAQAAKQAMLAKLKPKPTVIDPEFEARQAAKKAELEAVRQQRAAEREAKRIAQAEAERVQRETAAVSQEEAERELRAAQKAARDARYAARKQKRK